MPFDDGEEFQKKSDGEATPAFPGCPGDDEESETYAVGVAVAFHLRVRLHEERRLKRQFGEEWERYAAKVPRWVSRGFSPKCP